MVINIQDDILKIHAMGLLSRALEDKTTKQRILWATDAYGGFGRKYERNEEIQPELITGTNAGMIKTRARKAMEQQSERTRQRAEVFTPLWICRKMNDYADEVWFDAPDVFFKDGEPTAKISFPEKKTWQQYVNSRRLEITCGEAPYLVSRYDVETGEYIPIHERVGLLDRKLRVITENAQSQEEWLKWTLRAFQATYGYEFQGDNVLIARVNLLMTFEEYLWDRWKRKPMVQEYKKFLNIICWNIWQMDGLSSTIPFGTVEQEEHIDWFGWFDTKKQNEQPPCRIYNWRGGRSEKYSSLPRKGNHPMKFDFIIGNPPYQDETVGEQKTFAPPIYHLFLDAAYKIADKVELIHPARFLFNAGSTPKQWNQKMLSDSHLKVLFYEQDASKIFANKDIKGGIAITYRDVQKDYGVIGTFIAYSELNSILYKVQQHPDFSSFSQIVITRTAYRLTDKLHKDYPEALNQLSTGHAYDMSTNIFERLPQVFFDVMPNDEFEYIQILGRIENDRVCKFIRSDYVNEVINLYKYKIYLPKANGIGTLGEILSSPILSSPGVGATETFLSIGTFETEEEAKRALKYIKTKFSRVMLGILKTTQDITPQKWRYVPLQNFTPSSDIDWSKSIPEIDQQLYAKYGLDEKEIEFIETHVKEME